MEVTPDTKEQLIAAVELRSAIWDKLDRGHKDKRLVAALWQNIASELHINVKELKEKIWKNLTDTFRKNYKILKHKHSGDEYKMEQEMDFITWPYFRTRCNSGTPRLNTPTDRQKRKKTIDMCDDMFGTLSEQMQEVSNAKPHAAIHNVTFCTYLATMLDILDPNTQVQCHRLITDMVTSAFQTGVLLIIQYEVENEH